MDLGSVPTVVGVKNQKRRKAVKSKGVVQQVTGSKDFTLEKMKKRIPKGGLVNPGLRKGLGKGVGSGLKKVKAIQF